MQALPADKLLRNPALWPHRWLLPLVRQGSQDTFNDDDLGLLTHDYGQVLPTVFLGNLVDVHCPEDLKKLPAVAYASLEALSHEWRVD